MHTVFISEPHTTDYKAFKRESQNCSAETNFFNGWNIITFNIITGVYLGFSRICCLALRRSVIVKGSA